MTQDDKVEVCIRVRTRRAVPWAQLHADGVHVDYAKAREMAPEDVRMTLYEIACAIRILEIEEFALRASDGTCSECANALLAYTKHKPFDPVPTDQPFEYQHEARMINELAEYYGITFNTQGATV